MGRGDPGAPQGPLRAAAARRRLLARRSPRRAGSAPARVINTSSGAGLQGSVGQATYSAAKAGIAGLTLVAAQELGRYGVTVNAIAPVARTRMTEGPSTPQRLPDPADNSPVVAWLASEEAGDVTGRVIEIEGGRASPSRTAGPHGPAATSAPAPLGAPEVGPALRGCSLAARARAPERGRTGA